MRGRWGGGVIFKQSLAKLDPEAPVHCSSAVFVSLSSLHSHAPRMIQPLLTQLSGAARFKCKHDRGPKRPRADASYALSHYAGLPVILPRDNRSLRGAARSGHPQWRSPANLLSETNLFDVAVQDMDLKLCLGKKRKKKKSCLFRRERIVEGCFIYWSCVNR